MALLPMSLKKFKKIIVKKVKQLKNEPIGGGDYRFIDKQKQPSLNDRI